eukprot:scaffold333167_cov32-Prasinocladus_malaysianus.AAC.1
MWYKDAARRSISPKKTKDLSGKARRQTSMTSRSTKCIILDTTTAKSQFHLCEVSNKVTSGVPICTKLKQVDVNRHTPFDRI